MQPKMMKLIYRSHLDIAKALRSRARDILYWQGMSFQIQDIISPCVTCKTYQKEH